MVIPDQLAVEVERALRGGRRVAMTAPLSEKDGLEIDQLSAVRKAFEARRARTPSIIEPTGIGQVPPVARAVVVAAALSGFGAGVGVSVLAAAAGLACDALSGPLGSGNWIAAGVFVLVGVIVSAGGHFFQRARGHADAVNANLVRRETHLRSVLETVPDAMIVIDDQGGPHPIPAEAEPVAPTQGESSHSEDNRCCRRSEFMPTG